jgi:hypothetical protein
LVYSDNLADYASVGNNGYALVRMTSSHRAESIDNALTERGIALTPRPREIVVVLDNVACPQLRIQTLDVAYQRAVEAPAVNLSKPLIWNNSQAPRCGERIRGHTRAR